MKVKALIRYYESLLKDTGVFISISTKTLIEATIRALKKLPGDKEV